MDEIKINGKAIYTTKGAAREYGRVGCNFYTGCPHGCEYCYLKRGITAKTLGGTEVLLKKCFKDEGDALETFCREVRKHRVILQETGVFFSFTTDPMIPKTRDLTISALNMLNCCRIPATILTKDATWLDDERVTIHLQAIADRKYDIRFGFTLTGRDDMEPNASTNADRINAMRRLHNMGIKTWASIEPVITWAYSRQVIETSLDCCDHYKIGLRSGVKKDYYGLVSSGMSIDKLTSTITSAGRTVYLKESVRELLHRCYQDEFYNKILLRTVDMDGERIINNLMEKKYRQ